MTWPISKIIYEALIYSKSKRNVLNQTEEE